MSIHSVRVRKDTKDQLVRLSEQLGLSVSSMICGAVEEIAALEPHPELEAVSEMVQLKATVPDEAWDQASARARSHDRPLADMVREQLEFLISANH